jgi:hypothetical protein
MLQRALGPICARAHQPASWVDEAPTCNGRQVRPHASQRRQPLDRHLGPPLARVPPHLQGDAGGGDGVSGLTARVQRAQRAPGAARSSRPCTHTATPPDRPGPALLPGPHQRPPPPGSGGQRMPATARCGSGGQRSIGLQPAAAAQPAAASAASSAAPSIAAPSIAAPSTAAPSSSAGQQQPAEHSPAPPAPAAARRRALRKLALPTKLWVTATVKSRLSTACHQPPGTYIVSPGRWMTSMGLGPGQPGCWVSG